MSRLLIAVAVSVLGFTAQAAAQGCTTTKPGPINGQEWICQNGGWLPPGSVVTPPVPPPVVVVPFDQPAPRRAFWLGHRYTRGTTDVSIVGTGQVAGASVLFALCNEEGDGCFFKGMLRMFLSNAESTGWDYRGPY